MTLIEKLQGWWDRVQARRLTSRVTFLANRVATLQGELKAERVAREQEWKITRGALKWLAECEAQRKAQIVEHHAWLAALVELQQSNPGRYRTLVRSYERRFAALQATPSSATVAEDVPAAEPETAPETTAVAIEQVA